MKKLLLTISISFMCGASLAIADEETNHDFEVMMQKPAFQEYVRHQQDTWFAYEHDIFKKYDKYKAQIESIWGYAEVNSATKLAVYSIDKKSKLTVNHKTQEITISTIENKESLSNEHIKVRVREMMFSKLTLPVEDNDGHTAELTVAESLGIELKQVEILAEKLAESNLVVSEPDQIKGVIDDIDAKLQQVKNEYLNIFDSGFDKSSTVAKRQKNVMTKLESEKKRYAALEKKLRNNPRDKRTVSKKLPITLSYWRAAQPYLDSVAKLAEQQKLADSLVLAMIEVESSYNPLARSGVPAYGLMQIVRHSAGADVYQRLNNKVGSPKAQDLYRPSFNISYGANYLNILYYSYLSKIKSPKSRLYCVIAAYNTGVGNVAKVFTSEKRIIPATKVINSMSSDEVLSTLLRDLPYQETKNYVSKVLAAYNKYNKLVPTEHFL
jgi:membrane-bound lytic murein transglycosylase C